ncbi:MAG: Imm74 family immunity protein [Verrucomicrobiota bacterium]
MFTTPRPNIYESTDGFSVEVLGRTGLTYREGNHEMFIDSEVLAGPAGIVVYRDTISRWQPPHDGELINDEICMRILENIKDAFRFQGFEIEVI